MNFEVLYENEDFLAIDKPAGIIVFPEGKIKEKTIIDFLLEKFPELKKVGSAPRYGIVHRLDKDTSGILLVAKNNKVLEFLQKEFKTGRIYKKYLALAIGKVKNKVGKIETLIGRSPKDRKKQKVFLFNEPGAKERRKAETHYKVLKKYKKYTLIEVEPKTGRKHQIRVHLAHLGYPVAGDKLYDFKNQPVPKGLKRQFLHASFLKIKVSVDKEIKIKSELPENLKKILENLK